jgi:hypothetical protein
VPLLRAAPLSRMSDYLQTISMSLQPLNRLEWGWGAMRKSQEGDWLRHCNLRVRIAAVRFGHEDETDGDQGSNHQNHQEKDLPSRGFLQMTIVSGSDHVDRMQLRAERGFPGWNRVIAGRRERWICYSCRGGRDE